MLTFLLPILPNRYILTQQTSFSVQKRLSLEKKYPKIPYFSKFQDFQNPKIYVPYSTYGQLSVCEINTVNSGQVYTRRPISTGLNDIFFRVNYL